MLFLVFLNGFVQEGHIIVFFRRSFFLLLLCLNYLILASLLLFTLLVLLLFLFAFFGLHDNWLSLNFLFFFLFTRGSCSHHSCEPRGLRLILRFIELCRLTGQFLSINIRVFFLGGRLLHLPFDLSIRHACLSSSNFFINIFFNK